MKKKYWSFLKKYLFSKKKWIICLITLSIVQCVLNILIPIYYKIIIDIAIVNKELQLFFTMLICMALSFLLVSVFAILKDYILSKLSETMAGTLRMQLNDKISSMEYQMIEEHELSDIIARYSKEVEIVKENAGKYFVKLFTNVFTVLLASTMIIMFDWKILLITLLMIFIYIGINKYFGIRLKKCSEKVMKCNAEAIECISENYSNILTIKMYNLFDYTAKRFRKIYNKQYDAQVNYDLMCSTNINCGTLLIQMLGCLIWGIGGYSVFMGISTIGSIMTIINYQGMLLSPINFLCQFNNSYQSALAAISRIMDILDLPDEPQDGVLYKGKIDNVTIDNLSFSYKTRENVLENISVVFEKGTITALMGPSGCGKSTVLKILLGLYTYKNGKISFNGKKMHSQDIISSRTRIAYVAQESVFFKGTIKENLFLETNDDMKAVEVLSKKFDLYEEVTKLPDIWDTLLNSGTTNLSTGQKKRLDLIRAFLGEKDIIILDEPTAALDIQRRKKLYEYLNSIKENKIIIIVTHNADESEYFDKILFLEKE